MVNFCLSNMSEDDHTISNQTSAVLYHYIHLVSISSCLLELITAQKSLSIPFITNVVITFSENFCFFHVINWHSKSSAKLFVKTWMHQINIIDTKDIFMDTFDNFSLFSFLTFEYLILKCGIQDCGMLVSQLQIMQLAHFKNCLMPGLRLKFSYKVS